MGSATPPPLPVRQRYFIDTNALLARFLRQVPGHALLSSICDPTAGHTLFIAEITEAELCATFNQLWRGGSLRQSVAQRLVATFWQQINAGEYVILPITTPAIHQAAALCAVHSLRGYDAVQLSCAMTARDNTRVADTALAVAGSGNLPQGDPIFLTADQRLQQAAVAEGFVIIDPTAIP